MNVIYFFDIIELKFQNTHTHTHTHTQMSRMSVFMKKWFLFFTDTESSYGGGESPILFPKRRKSHSASSCVLGLTPGGSMESGKSTSLDIGMQLYVSLLGCKSVRSFLYH